MKAIIRVFSVIFLVSSCNQHVFGKEEKEPLWEFGVATAGIHSPHYLGADQQQTYALPVPFFIYRGERIKADRNGIRSQLFKSDKWSLNVNTSASLPVDSEDNDAREGMADLDFTLELGPTLEYQFFKKDQHGLRFELPLGASFSIGDKLFKHEGWTINPRLHYQTVYKSWQFSSTLGPVFSDSNYHGYIYDVSQSDARIDRPFYQARAGFTATRFAVNVKRKLGDYFIGARLRYSDLHGAANIDSPLLRQTDHLAISFIAAWVFGESKTRAQ